MGKHILNFCKYAFVFGIGAVFALRDGEKALKELNDICDSVTLPSFIRKED